MNNVVITELNKSFTKDEIKMIQDNTEEIINFLKKKVIPYLLGCIVVEFEKYQLFIDKTHIYIKPHLSKESIKLLEEGIGLPADFRSDNIGDKIEILHSLLSNWKNNSNLKNELECYVDRRKSEIEVLNHFVV